MNAHLTDEQRAEINSGVLEVIRKILPDWKGYFGVAVQLDEYVHTFVHDATLFDILEIAASLIKMAQRHDEVLTLAVLLEHFSMLFKENIVAMSGHGETKH